MSAARGVAATVHVGTASATAAAKAPVWVWFAIVGGVVALSWSWVKSQQDEVPDWLDPNNPPISAQTDYSTTLLGAIATAPGQDTGGRKAAKTYPWATLMSAPCCWVGDC